MQAESLCADAALHVVVGGRSGRRLFSYPRDYRAYIACLTRAAATTRCQIHAACLLPNQVQLLLAPPTNEAVAALLHAAHEPYMVLRNASRNASGPLFERTAWSARVDHPEQIGAATAYIENTPVRRGGVADAAGYRWSTHPIATGDGGEPWRKVWAPSSWYRSLGDSAGARAERYRSYFASASREGVRLGHEGELLALERSRPQSPELKGS